MTKEELQKLFEEHSPYFDTAECDLCGSHTYSMCSCGWYGEARSGPDDYFTHLLDQVED